MSFRGWAHGNLGEGIVDYADLIDANTSPHDTSTMSTPGDGTYLSLDQAGFHSDLFGRIGSGGPYFLSSIARMDYPANIPEGITELYIAPIFRVRTSAVTPPRNFHGIAYSGNGSQSYTYSSPDVASTDWFDNYDAGFWSVFHTSVEGTRLALNAGLGHMSVEPFDWGRNGDAPDPAPSWVDEIDYMAIRLWWPGPTIAPPLRQYPRSDGLGTSSARRQWPPSRSYQRSNRRAGGYL